ncbi:MAG: hypothetical protein ACXWQE_05220 [Bdellovibrionales bacterium]
MKSNDLLKTARQTIKNVMPEFQTQLATLLKEHGSKTELIEFQIYVDAFEVVAYIGQKEAWPKDVRFKTQPFAPMSDLLEKIPEPATKEDYQDQEKIFVEIYELMFHSFVEAWAQLKPKPKIEAYVRQADGSEAIELTTRKKVDVSQYDSRLYYLRPEPKRIEYPPISDSERLSLPKLFARPPGKMSDEEIEKELSLYFDFVKNEFARILPLVTGIFKTFINTHANDLKKAGFIDIMVEAIHVVVAAVPKDFKDEMHLPLGDEINLGHDNPLNRYNTFVVDTISRLSFDSARDLDVSQAIADLRTENGLKVNIKKAWDAAAQDCGLPPTFVRAGAMNRWMDMENLENELSLEQISTLKL